MSDREKLLAAANILMGLLGTIEAILNTEPLDNPNGSDRIEGANDAMNAVKMILGDAVEKAVAKIPEGFDNVG